MNNIKRIYERFCDKSISIFFKFGEKTIKGVSVNISYDGICAVFENLPTDLQEKEIDLKLKIENGATEQNAQGKILWVSNIGNGEFLAGICFIQKTNLSKYEEYIDKLSK